MVCSNLMNSLKFKFESKNSNFKTFYSGYGLVMFEIVVFGLFAQIKVQASTPQYHHNVDEMNCRSLVQLEM